MSYDKKSDIYGQKLRIVDVLLISFEQIVNFCAIIHSNTNSVQLFCEKSSLNLESFTELALFCIILEKFTWAQKYLTQVPLVTNSMSASGGTIFSLQADSYCQVYVPAPLWCGL